MILNCDNNICFTRLSRFPGTNGENVLQMRETNGNCMRTPRYPHPPSSPHSPILSLLSHNFKTNSQSSHQSCARTVVDDPAAIRAPSRGEADVMHLVRRGVRPVEELMLVDVSAVTHAQHAVTPAQPEVPGQDSDNCSNVYTLGIVLGIYTKTLFMNMPLLTNSIAQPASKEDLANTTYILYS